MNFDRVAGYHGHCPNYGGDVVMQDTPAYAAPQQVYEAPMQAFAQLQQQQPLPQSQPQWYQMVPARPDAFQARAGARPAASSSSQPVAYAQGVPQSQHCVQHHSFEAKIYQYPMMEVSQYTQTVTSYQITGIGNAQNAQQAAAMAAAAAEAVNRSIDQSVQNSRQMMQQMPFNFNVPFGALHAPPTVVAAQQPPQAQPQPQQPQQHAQVQPQQPHMGMSISVPQLRMGPAGMQIEAAPIMLPDAMAQHLRHPAFQAFQNQAAQVAAAHAQAHAQAVAQATAAWEEQVRRQRYEEAIRQSMEASSRGPPPAAPDAVNQLPVELVSSNPERFEGKACAVCQDAFRPDQECMSMPCDHPYHRDCLMPWLQQHNSCPLCRCELPTVDAEYNRRLKNQSAPSNSDSSSSSSSRSI